MSDNSTVMFDNNTLNIYSSGFNVEIILDDDYRSPIKKYLFEDFVNGDISEFNITKDIYLYSLNNIITMIINNNECSNYTNIRYNLNVENDIYEKLKLFYLN